MTQLPIDTIEPAPVVERSMAEVIRDVLDTVSPESDVGRICAEVGRLRQQIADSSPAHIQGVAHHFGQYIVHGSPGHSGWLPEDHESQHNCDAMGCGHDHVLFRTLTLTSVTPCVSYDAQIACLKQKLSAREADVEVQKSIVRDHSRLVHELQSKLAAHAACLTQVREEMPEVERIRRYHHAEGGKHEPCETFISTLLTAYDQQCQNEARWRNCRDRWDAQSKQLQETVASLGARLADAIAAREDAKSERDLMLSVAEYEVTVYLSNAVDAARAADKATIADLQSKCAELHERLARSEAALRTIASNKTRHMEINHAYCVNTAIEALAAADGKQQPFDGGTYDDDQCGGDV